MADMAHISGLIAGGSHPSPAGHAQIVTSSTHKTLRGPRGGLVDLRFEVRAPRGPRRVPRLAGRTDDERDRREGGDAEGSGDAGLPAVRPTDGRERADAGGRRSKMPAYVWSPVGPRLTSYWSTSLRSDVVGNVAATALEHAGIVTNYNTIPFDPQPPTIGSGVRMGTPALTTRGMGAGRDEARLAG